MLRGRVIPAYCARSPMVVTKNQKSAYPVYRAQRARCPIPDVVFFLLGYWGSNAARKSGATIPFVSSLSFVETINSLSMLH